MKGQTLQEWAGASRIFALVFTDIVDSTKLASELGDERWIDLFLKHCARARELMPKYNGHEIKTIGDSFMVIFRTALDAMDFLLALVSDTGDERLRIRAGIHVGSARIIGDDIFGNMVNYTKRVEGTDLPVAIRLSDAAKNQITDEKAERHSRLSFHPLEVEFKGFTEPQRIWAVFTPRDVFMIGTEALINSWRRS
ncbi:MAG TPA: adenylate/guanylate cyclase domain-containing protein [Pyrinomonadaceae bacterium]|nr:adenylate/guanylate cyclase domain-containing protein [Pyrinomonadaceae bacterium]